MTVPAAKALEFSGKTVKEKLDLDRLKIQNLLNQKFSSVMFSLVIGHQLWVTLANNEIKSYCKSYKSKESLSNVFGPLMKVVLLLMKTVLMLL